MIEVRVDGRKVDRPTPQQVRQRRGGGLMWVDAVTCDEAEIGWLTEAFDIHPLAVEDMTQRNERPRSTTTDTISSWCSSPRCAPMRLSAAPSGWSRRTCWWAATTWSRSATRRF